MSNKKSHRKSRTVKRDPSILEGIDDKLDRQYEEIVKDIEEIQYQISIADRRKEMRAKKKMKKGKIAFYDTRCSEARLVAARRLSSDDIITTLINIFNDLKPLAVLLARLIGAIICSILSLDVVKRNISSTAFERIQSLYQLCKRIGE